MRRFVPVSFSESESTFTDADMDALAEKLAGQYATTEESSE